MKSYGIIRFENDDYHGIFFSSTNFFSVIGYTLGSLAFNLVHTTMDISHLLQIEVDL